MVTEPLTSTSKTLDFSIASADEYVPGQSYDKNFEQTDAENEETEISPDDQQAILEELKDQNDLMRRLLNMLSQIFGIDNS